MPQHVIQPDFIFTETGGTDTPVPVRIESPTDAEVLLQVNAIAPAIQPGALHKYVTAYGNEIVYKVLNNVAGDLVLHRITDRVRLYDVTELPNTDHFQLNEIIEVDGQGYKAIDDGLGAGGFAWETVGDNYGGSGSAANLNFDRHTVSATLEQQTYTLPNEPIPESVIVQIDGAGNNIDFSVVGSDVILSAALAANVGAAVAVVFTYAY